MKLSRLIRYLLLAFFSIGLYFVYIHSNLKAVIWVMFFPIKALQYIATDVLHLQQEQIILFSLACGIPMTVLYWWFWLRGSKALVRR